LNESWDSPHNKQLIAKMPFVYRTGVFELPPDTIKPGHTTFLAPVGENTVFGAPKATNMSQIADGTSFTALIVNVKPSLAVPWTAPEDYRFDPDDPAAGLRIESDGRWQCGFAEGSVRQLRSDLPVEVFLRLFQMNDREIVDFDELQ
jgi:hypothetical protein